MDLFDSEYREKYSDKKPWLSWIPYGFPFYYAPLVKDGNYKLPKFSFDVPDGLGVEDYYANSELWVKVAKHFLYRSQVTGEQLEEILEAAYFIVKQKQKENTEATPKDTGDSIIQEIFEEQGDRIAEMLLQGVRYARIAEAINCSKSVLKDLIDSDRIQNLLSEKKEELKLLTSLLGVSISYEYYKALNKSLNSLTEDSEAFATTLKVASVEVKAVSDGTKSTTKEVIAKAEILSSPSSDQLIERFENYAFGLSDEI